MLDYFSGDWDVHSEYGILTHGQNSPKSEKPNGVNLLAEPWRSFRDSCLLTAEVVPN